MAASSSVAGTGRRSDTTRIGEVIETTTTGFVAESDQLHELPELGALVCVGGVSSERSYFGVVSWGATGGLDSSRKAVRRGGADLSDHEIFDRHPELDLILRTIFGVAIVGYREDGRARHVPPPLPVPLHFSVHRCDRESVSVFCEQPRYLAALLNTRDEVLPEHLVAAHLRWVDRALSDNHVWLSDATRRVARLMKRDYDRLVTVLESVDPD